MSDILSALLDRTFAEPDPEGLAVLDLSLLDWIACARAGVPEPVSGVVRSLASAPGSAALVGGGRTDPRTAAMINATIGHALDYDDTHFDHIGHVSTVILPAALALAGTWDSFRAAALAGAEVAIACGTWLGRDHYQAGFHQTATSGAFGATAACARLLGLGRDQTAHALCLCASRAAGLKSQFGTMGKPMNAGQAAATGLECAMLAHAGATSTPAALDGPQGFAPTHHGAGAPLANGPRFHAIAHKLHACCHGLHAALESLSNLKAQGLDLAQAQAITVTTHPRWLSVCNQPNPETGLSAKFSYAQALALAAAGHDTAALETWSDALCADPGVLALRARVSVKPDAALADTAARLDVDGTKACHDLSDPMPLAKRQARVHAKARALIGGQADTLATQIAQGDLKGVIATLNAT